MHTTDDSVSWDKRWLEVRARIAWAYAGLLGLWWVLHVSLGDRLWWLALLSVFAPYLFCPLALLAPLGLVKPRVRVWGAVLLAVAILLLEYGRPLNVRAAAPPRTADELTVLSFNVWGYSDSIETVDAIVSQGIPDVVALQELSPALARTLVEELGAVYPYHLLDPKARGKGGGILSRHPIKDMGGPVSALVPFAQVVEVQVEDRALTLYNVHLEATVVFSYLERGESVSRGVRRTFETRERQVSLLMDDLAHRRGPVILAGDFNLTQQSDAYRTLTRALQDAHREEGRGFGHTFPAYRGRFRGIPILPRLLRLDMILYSPEWTAQESRVLREHGQSDHLPVLARLAWPL